MSDNASSLAYQRSAGSSSSSLSEMSVDHDAIDTTDHIGIQVQQLYRPDDRSPWRRWVPNPTATDAEVGTSGPDCAFVVRREPHPITHQVALHSITVHSPVIRKVLHSTFEGFEGLNTQLKQLTFKAPFYPFYYRWHRFEKLCGIEQDPETKHLLDLLYPILSEEILPQVEAMTDLTQNKVMSFDYLWTIFAPGMEVYTSLDGQDRLMELTDSRYGASMSGEFFTLECRYIDCDGSSFGYLSSSVDINKFEGVKKIVDLDAFPGHLYPDVEHLVDRLHTRGEKLEQLNGFRHMSYSGFYTARSSRQIRKRHVENSRVIIDPYTFNLYGAPGPGLRPIESQSDSHSESAHNESLANIDSVIYKATDQAFRKYQNALAKYQKRRTEDSLSSVQPLSPKHRLLCTPVVRGYCLAFKTWAEFYVGNVNQIRWSNNAFPKLVLPHGYKEIIRAFVQEQLSRDDGFDDIVQGKGLGFIMLLSGEPGVGKTLTAESVAEEMRQPLYLMSASELGETATEVEESLEQVLELANKWNAILLLDECDVFLEARTTTDIRRNRLVSVFLRQLEYYRGVMFLTSNRIDDFDPAFESRIHLTIHYPPLDTSSRLHIWKIFVQMGDIESRLSEKDLETLAKMEANGRQIKNIVKTARLLSKQEQAPLSMEHIEMVLKVKKGSFV
ncbi:hypothetical protein BP5796_10794 [Coleophoma crateriformis]|uniref:AAA+ ATPase domain-containing protein n=1 Tax=Coleophoma crateriformis TaxID=565419 RepID=A0A3D8QL20_9HELO|nr:hypothetical protein BP5796_10794 [Coleophoma crateriformis]